MAIDLPPAEPRTGNGAFIRDLRHELRLALGILDSLTAKIESIEHRLAMLEAPGIGSGGYSPTPPPVRVAHNLEIQPRPDGSAEMTIDSGRKLSLGPRLAEVFQFLASGEKSGAGADPLVGWRSRPEILKFLSDSTGEEFRKSYVNNMVHLLRKALRKAGYDRGLIQTHRQKGIRFALKRGAQGVLKSITPEW